ncbi:hypothetical protein MetMK1DRAFT_00024380 [Metallosphaera yellowstonensis MK1]|uniref:Uncharacterized protein n=1 Tax=Metallosphaera yellowstonensis MK1 TaxID=671065 RepID=H2C789_9CREN|nr:hypothetical protein MetMK1DRAFT_00024380 [Metallosphaera yellowstonensis MK1]
MDQNWFNLPLLRRNGIKYISENFYPAKYMTRWKEMRGLSLRLAQLVRLYSLTQVMEEIDHFEFFRKYFEKDPLNFDLPESYITWFDDILESLRRGDVEEIAVRFHMLTEGVLATVGLSILRKESSDLPEFNSGIRKIIEDEARHVNFGFQLIRDKTRAIDMIQEFYPRAEAIIMDGMSYIEPMGYSWNELKGLMIELRDSRIRKLQER